MRTLTDNAHARRTTLASMDRDTRAGFRFRRVCAVERSSRQLARGAPHYDGKVIVLVDEVSVSQAEYTAIALRASPRAIVIGSTTAGADGNVSMIALPGKRRTAISGIGVFYPDKRRTQQIGIVPDIVVKPTIAGIRDGKDEVLERAISELSR